MLIRNGIRQPYWKKGLVGGSEGEVGGQYVALASARAIAGRAVGTSRTDPPSRRRVFRGQQRRDESPLAADPIAVVSEAHRTDRSSDERDREGGE